MKKETKIFLSFLMIVEISFAMICALYMEGQPNGHNEPHSVNASSKVQLVRELNKIVQANR